MAEQASPQADAREAGQAQSGGSAKEIRATGTVHEILARLEEVSASDAAAERVKGRLKAAAGCLVPICFFGFFIGIQLVGRYAGIVVPRWWCTALSSIVGTPRWTSRTTSSDWCETSCK